MFDYFSSLRMKGLNGLILNERWHFSSVHFVDFENNLDCYVIHFIIQAETSLSNRYLSDVTKDLMIVQLNPSRSDLIRREKINVNLYFHKSLWYHKMFYEGFTVLFKYYCIIEFLHVYQINTSLARTEISSQNNLHILCCS